MSMEEKRWSSGVHKENACPFKVDTNRLLHVSSTDCVIKSC